jgi:hypothetical protein
MMKLTIATTHLLALSNAFLLPSGSTMPVRPSRASNLNDDEAVYFTGTFPVSTFRYVGDLPPLNFFDPMQITANTEEEQIKYLREAELHHARVAMAAFPTLVAADHLRPGLAINDLYKTPLVEQFPFWIGITAYEFARMGNGWKNPFIEDKFFKLKKEYQPGNLFNLDMKTVSNDRLNQELSNGRLAMLGTLGYLAQELVTHQKPF